MSMDYDLLIKGGEVLLEHGRTNVDLAINKGKISAMGSLSFQSTAAQVIDASNLVVMPGLVDPHCHFREPGPNEEEDFATGTMAALAGGVTSVLEQPVDTPPTTTGKRLIEKFEIGLEKSYTDFGLWGGVIPENLDEINSLAEKGACAFKAFACSSDPLYPMTDDGHMLEAMRIISDTGKLLAIHCENEDIIAFYKGRYEEREKISAIDHARSRPPIAELEAVQRMILLAHETDVQLHILHTTLPDAIHLVLEARERGQNVTVETCPHYLILSDEALEKYGPYAKCNPPLRSETNKSILWEQINQGLIDCIVSDHSPYTTQDKKKGLQDIRKSPPGINGLELGLSLLISEGVHKNKISLSMLAKLMSTNPAKIFDLYPQKGHIAIGADADLTLINLEKEWIVDKDELYTKNKWTPYDGWKIKGKVNRTIVRGKTVYREGEFPIGPGFGKFLAK